ncbi:MAG: radical SAM protein [Candidatus Omnitrophota bacterium]
MLEKSKLHSLYIYLTDACNLKCTHCWQSAPLDESGKYSRLEFEPCRRFIDDAIDMGLKGVTFSGGEPLLNKEFPKFAEYLTRKGIHMNLETNGLLLSNPGIIDTIKNGMIYCAVSLDGVKSETHNLHRGVKTAYDRTVKNLKLFDETGLYYQIITAVSKFNYHELIPLMEWIQKELKHCNTLKINIVSAVGRAKEMEEKGLLFKPHELPQITEDIAPLIDKYPFKISLHIDPVFFSFKNLMRKYSCGGHCGYRSSLSILANGKVSICSLGKEIPTYVFGHVTTIDLKDQWENNVLLNAIHGDTHLNLKGICSQCIFRMRCLGGCRAGTLFLTNDFFSPNPVCQEYFDSGYFPESRLINPNISQ